MGDVTIIIGELLPWKNVWWEVIDFNPSTNHITLSKRKQTTGALKKEVATKKWKRNHPLAVHNKRS